MCNKVTQSDMDRCRRIREQRKGACRRKATLGCSEKERHLRRRESVNWARWKSSRAQQASSSPRETGWMGRGREAGWLDDAPSSCYCSCFLSLSLSQGGRVRQNQVSLALDPTQANESGKRDLTLRGLSCSCRRVTVNQCDRPLRQERSTAGSVLCCLCPLP